MENMTKERLIDIVVTALIGAGIAFLQSLLASWTGSHVPTPQPEVAAAAAGSLKLFVGRIYTA